MERKVIYSPKKIEKIIAKEKKGAIFYTISGGVLLILSTFLSQFLPAGIICMVQVLLNFMEIKYWNTKLTLIELLGDKK